MGSGQLRIQLDRVSKPLSRLWFSSFELDELLMSLRIVLKAQPKTRRTRSQPFFHRCREPVYTVVFQSVVCPDLTSDQAFFLSLSLSLPPWEKNTLSQG